MKDIKIKIIDESQVRAKATYLTEEEAIKEAARKNIIVAYS